MHYNQLVRDHLPTILKKKGKNVTFHQASPEEFFDKLIGKLQIEIDEFLAGENLEDLADLIEIIYAIADYKKFSRKKLEMIRNQKELEKGCFKDRIILDEVSE